MVQQNCSLNVFFSYIRLGGRDLLRLGIQMERLLVAVFQYSLLRFCFFGFYFILKSFFFQYGFNGLVFCFLTFFYQYFFISQFCYLENCCFLFRKIECQYYKISFYKDLWIFVNCCSFSILLLLGFQVGILCFFFQILDFILLRLLFQSFIQFLLWNFVKILYFVFI